MFSTRAIPLLSLALALMGAGCAGSQLGKIEQVQELPKDLPTEVKTKFEIVDLPPAQQKPTPPKKAAKKKKAPAATPAAFAYPSRRPEMDAIWAGETMTYQITYLGLPAGDFKLEVLPFKAVGDRKVYHVRGIATSSKVFSLFYRLNDTVETFIDYEGIFSHRFHLVLDETKQTRDSLELYDSEKKQTYFWNRWNRHEKGYSETKEFHPIPAFPQDSLSSIFYIRTLPLVNGGVYQFPVVSEGKAWEAVVTVVRREEIDTPIGKRKAIVLMPDTKYEGVLKKNGDSFIWVSDDDRRVLLRIEAKVRIGTVVGLIKQFEPGQKP